MKKIRQIVLFSITVVSIAMYSCQPNNREGSTTQESIGGEGAIDSTKMPDFDSAHTADSSHTSL